MHTTHTCNCFDNGATPSDEVWMSIDIRVDSNIYGMSYGCLVVLKVCCHNTDLPHLHSIAIVPSLV